MNDISQHISTEETNSLFHKAASYAIKAIIAAFIAKFLFTAIWLDLPSRISEILGYLISLLLISAIPAGFIALCGIPRFGKRKLLWKGLVGLLLPMILIIVSLSVQAMLIESVRQHPELLKQSEAAKDKP